MYTAAAIGLLFVAGGIAIVATTAQDDPNRQNMITFGSFAITIGILMLGWFGLKMYGARSASAPTMNPLAASAPPAPPTNVALPPSNAKYVIQPNSSVNLGHRV